MKIIIQFEKKPILFQDPHFIIRCNQPAQLDSCFTDMEAALKKNYYLAGFLSYEAGYCFEEKLRENKNYEFPLIYLGAYAKPSIFKPYFDKSRRKERISNPCLNISREKYFSNIHAIRSSIAKGDVYQITYCLKLLFEFSGDTFHLYNTLLNEQPVPYPAYLETNEFKILSLSPEMFIKKTGRRVITKPMKGTWQRGINPASDFCRRIRFKFDRKNRAENLMIADLLRNDLGRIGTDIRAPKLFDVTGYKTLFQMTSTVTGKMDNNISLYGLFKSIFPSGSVTGTPKIRAMEIIKEIEPEERRIYTGAIGYITPEKDLFFNVPIRTLLIKDGRGEMGIGGGIVWDSTPLGEWNEGLLKASFLTKQNRGQVPLF
ncbi:MAG: chorismate-binding protein [Candidatus Omnitrophota bacterium]|nr:chorismate-binding protein [Candidatus Omnitrophota bacterium]MBU1929629.1 chorismate-binding protein [Candidatus Omnitrophota bacterium]MBU2034567.1 chorismate-binding protein [Candidatus Omnitrophota bacterium]